jgi:hypothetical protein
MKRMQPGKASISLILAIAAAALLFGCRTGSPAVTGGGYPPWYRDPYALYPKEKYLAAVGSGDTRADAQREALSGLAQLISVNVSVDLTSRELYRELSSERGLLTDEELELTSTTSLESDQTLLNVRFGEAAVDRTGTVHIIAFLDREASGRIYLDAVRLHAAQIAELLDAAERAENPLRRFAALAAAQAVGSAYASLVTQLRVISPAMVPASASLYSYPDLERRARAAQSELRICLDITGRYREELAAAVSSLMTAEGFSVTPLSPTCDLVVRGQADVAEAQLNPDFATLRWDLQVNAALPGGETIVRIDTQGRTSGINSAAAASLVRMDIQEILSDEFLPQLRLYLGQPER